ncbi:MAG: hypothetical protein LQ342_002807 [Letrouitia transgressa]|nr:MAG: hypothetical protein LQ342_002807 [Letrouitia transgressa]
MASTDTNTLEPASTSHFPTLSLDEVVDLIACIVPWADKTQRFLTLLHPVIQHVRLHEPNTLRYTIHIQSQPVPAADKDGLGRSKGPKIFISERYRDEEAFQTHLTSDALKLLFTQIKEEGLLAEAEEVDRYRLSFVGGFDGTAALGKEMVRGNL